MLRCSLFLAVAALTCSSLQAAEHFDVLITNGTVYDGSGSDGRVTDIGLRDGKVVFVGEAKAASADERMDATGLVVAPGFIDVHNHVAEAHTLAPKPFLNEQFLTQGVTTVVVGPDGFQSPAGLRQIFGTLKAKGFGTNYACYVGHNGIRGEVLHGAKRKATAREITLMAAMVREGMQMGCVGLSTGLMYDPGMFSDTAEVIELAKEVKPFHGTYDSHTRDPALHLLESEKEAVDIGRAAGIPVKLAHEKATGLINKGQIGAVVDLVEEARVRGEEVVADQYPYDGAGTGNLRSLFVIPGEPAGGRNIPLTSVQSLLADASKQAAIRQATEHGDAGGFSWVKAVGYQNMRIVSAPDDPRLVDENIELLARKRGLDPYDLVVDLIRHSTHDIFITYGTVDEADVRALMVRPWVMIASDGGYVKAGVTTGGHPRSTGTFTRVLGHYSRDEKLLPLSEAIRKMTSLPADHLRLFDRGRLAVGYAADVTVFDPARVRDRSTYVNPNALSEGIVAVIVNGQFALRGGKVTGKAAGRFIPRQDARPDASGCSATVSLNQSRNSLSPATVAAIDAAARDLVGSAKAAGLGIAVVRGGRLALQRSYGQANLELHVPVDSNTVFRIASVTKQFTAAAILHLAEEGKLGLDDALAKYYPDFPRAATVTLRQLLSHTSGIHNFTEPSLPEEMGRVGATPAALIDYIANQKPLYDFEPGTRWWYSNSNYALLGGIIEKVSGQRYADYMAANIFPRAHLTHTAVDENSQIVEHRASGYSRDSRSPGHFVNSNYHDMSIPYAAGAIRSTVGDLASWMIALFDARVVSAASLREMIEPAKVNDGRLAGDAVNWRGPGPLPSPPPGFGKLYFGLGLSTDTFNGHRRVGHSGAYPGFSSFVHNYADDGVMTVVLANTDSAASEMDNSLAAALFCRR